MLDDSLFSKTIFLCIERNTFIHCVLFARMATVVQVKIFQCCYEQCELMIIYIQCHRTRQDNYLNRCFKEKLPDVRTGLIKALPLDIYDWKIDENVSWRDGRLYTRAGFIRTRVLNYQFFWSSVSVCCSCVRRRRGCGVPSTRHGVLRYVRIIATCVIP